MIHDRLFMCGSPGSTDAAGRRKRRLRAPADTMTEEVTKQVDLWPATQPKNPFDVVQATLQKDLQRQVSTAGPEPRSSLIGDAPEAVSAQSQEIRIPNRDEIRVFDSPRATVPLHR